MKVLCICNHGNNRSAALARCFKDLDGPCLGTGEDYLKIYAKYEAIAVGAHHHSPETLQLLINWADVVFDASDEPTKKHKVALQAGNKYNDIYPIIGYDSYGTPLSEDLLIKCRAIVEKFK